MKELLFDGILDKLDGDIAHITGTTPDGFEFYGEYPASEMVKNGIKERRRFKFFVTEATEEYLTEIEPIPDCILDEEHESQINKKLESLGNDDDEQDDY